MRSIIAVCVLGCLYASVFGEWIYGNDYDLDVSESEDVVADVFGHQLDQQEEGGEDVRGVIGDGNLILTVYRDQLDSVFGGGLASPPEESANHEPLPAHEVSQENEYVSPNSVIELAEKIDTLLSQLNQTFTEKVRVLEHANKKLQEKIDQVEQQTKTNSVVIFNVPEGRHESHGATLQKVLHVINRMMKVRVRADDIAVALRADPVVNGSPATARPIVVRFVQFATKMKVLGARGRLARSKVSMSSDYSEGVAAVRAALLPYLEAARARGQQAYVLYDRLVVDGVRKTLQELQAERAGLEPQPEEEPDQQVEEVEVAPQFQNEEFEEA